MNEAPLLAFESDKVRALLAFLAIEAGRIHRRETLCGLLWPDKPERLARRSLSQALYNLRQVIHNDQIDPPFLIISQYDIQFNPESHYQLDVAKLEQLSKATTRSSIGSISSEQLQRLQQLVELNSGDLLKGFSISDSSPFEEWLLLRRERYNRIFIDALRQLVETYCEQNEWEKAIRYAHLWLANDPYQEDAHYLLIQMLNHVGRRSDALAHFDACSKLLNAELGVKPTAKMSALAEEIRKGNALLGDSRSAVVPTQSTAMMLSKSLDRSRSAFMAIPKEANSLPLLARDQELASLHERLDVVLSGQGQVVFISGEAGRGKSALVMDFCRRAQSQHERIIVVGSSCSAYSGVGDSCAAFRDILALLTSDIDSANQYSLLSPAQIARLWELFPAVVQAILELSPGLLNTLIPSVPLLKRIAKMPGGADWLNQLRVNSSGIFENRQHEVTLPKQLFTQYMALLARLACQHPLILVLDDLHWADADTIGLLFYIGSRLTHLPILLIGCYRPSETILGHTQGLADGHHALPTILDEFRRLFGNNEIRLGRDSDLAFVNAYLDQMPNRFNTNFRLWLDRLTAGNPLFAIELVKDMQQNGRMTMDSTGYWHADPISEWKPLPARVDAVIEERLNRLPANMRRLLMVASVEGDTFTAEVLANVLRMSENEVIHLLSGELTYPYQLVRAQRVTFVGIRRVCTYRFRQPVFRHFLYNKLDEVERPLFHETIGFALEEIYGAKEELLIPLAPQLSHHFQMTGLLDKARRYWQLTQGTPLSILFKGYTLGLVAQSLLDQTL